MRKEVDTDIKIKVSNFFSFARLYLKCWFKKGQSPSAVMKPGRAVEMVFFFFFAFFTFYIGKFGMGLSSK